MTDPRAALPTAPAAILAAVIAPSAMSPVAMVPSAILADVIAPSAILAVAIPPASRLAPTKPTAVRKVARSALPRVALTAADNEATLHVLAPLAYSMTSCANVPTPVPPLAEAKGVPVRVSPAAINAPSVLRVSEADR